MHIQTRTYVVITRVVFQISLSMISVLIVLQRGKLNNFWVPGEVQAAKPALLKKPSTETMCPEDNHPIKLKELIKMNFTENKSKEAKHKYQCPGALHFFFFMIHLLLLMLFINT
jgi:hypothetical protein